jgi:hypothetical protein
MRSLTRSSRDFRPIVRPRSPQDCAPAGRDVETSGSLDRLLEEAMALCGTVDPDLHALLASVLEGRHHACVKIAATSGADPTEALLMAFHMFTYACDEARSIGRATIDLRRLEMCADYLADRLKLTSAVGIDDSPRCC